MPRQCNRGRGGPGKQGDAQGFKGGGRSEGVFGAYRRKKSETTGYILSFSERLAAKIFPGRTHTQRLYMTLLLVGFQTRSGETAASDCTDAEVLFY